MKFLESFFTKLGKWPRIIGGIVLFSWASNSGNLTPPMDIILGGVFCIMAAVWLSCSLIYKTPKRLQAEKEERLRKLEQELRSKEAENRKAQLEDEELARKAQQAQWQRTHGRIVTRLAGVTFDNLDGSSRQKYLKAAYEDGCAGDLQLDTYTYNGEYAIRLLYEGRELGNIPRQVVPEVLAVFNDIEDAELDIHIFEPDDWEEDTPHKKLKEIYRADLTLIYKKHEM